MDQSSGSYGQMNVYCSFGQFSGFIIWSSRLRQEFGQFLVRNWAWSLHEKWSILGLVSSPISLIPIGATQIQLWLKLFTGFLNTQPAWKSTLPNFISSNSQTTIQHSWNFLYYQFISTLSNSSNNTKSLIVKPKP